MTLRLNTAMRNRLADSAGTAFDSGTLKIYTGTQPASANDAASGTLLVTINLPADSFSAASSGAASKAGTWQGTAVSDGTAGWARFDDGAGLIVDGSVTATSGGGDIELDDTSIVTDGVVTVDTFTITQPAA